MYHIVVNPVAGHGKAVEFVQEHVVTLLNRLQEPYKVWTTTAPRHAGDIAKTILSEVADSTEAVKLVVAGGDGTAHELIEGIKSSGVKAGSLGIRWELVILPLGTANALHASLFSGRKQTLPSSLESLISTDLEVRKALSSLIAALDSVSSPLPLPITSTRILSPNPQQDTSEPIYSHVVTSTALHAAILQTSEELRAEHPGLERFKMAAERNLGVFFEARLRLLPPQGSTIQQYDPETKSFVAPYTTNNGDALEGPFTYVLSTTICDRLEPTFVINPTLKTNPPQSDRSMDLVVLRPLRDPDVRRANPSDQPEKWAKRAMEVIGQAYKEGVHVNLRYPDEGGQTVQEGDGQVAVETFRVGGFEWTPTDAKHTLAHLVCSDGAIHTIPPGGHARIEVASPKDDDHSFWVWS